MNMLMLNGDYIHRNVLQSEDIQDITDMDKRTRKRRRKNDDGYDGGGSFLTFGDI